MCPKRKPASSLFFSPPHPQAAGASWHSSAECHYLFPVKLSQGGGLQGGHERSRLELCLESRQPRVESLRKYHLWGHRPGEVRNQYFVSWEFYVPLWTLCLEQVVKSLCSRVRLPGFKSWIEHSLAFCPWTGCALSFLISRNGMIAVPTS